jgi:DNA-binding XRE family transcriptional regulator
MDNDIHYPRGVSPGETLVYGGPNTRCNISSLKCSMNKDHVSCPVCRISLGLGSVYNPEASKPDPPMVNRINPNDIKPSSEFEIKQAGEKVQVTEKIVENNPPVTQNISEYRQDITPHVVEIWTGPKGDTRFSVRSSASEPSLALEYALEQFNRLGLAAVPGFKKILLDQVVTMAPPPEPVVEVDNDQDEIEDLSHIIPNKNSFGNYLRKYRQEADIKIKEFSEKLHLKPVEIYRFETNKKKPSHEILIEISEILALPDVKYSKLKAKLKEGV